MKPSYDEATLAGYFQPLSPALWDDPIVGPVLRELEQRDPDLIAAVADVDRSQVRDALAKTTDQRVGEASGIVAELSGWQRVPG